MIRIDNDLVSELGKSTTVDELQYWIQKAIELEHSTIPPYLTAAFSIDKNSENNYVRKIIMSIAIEEMLHFTIACNLLISIGGKPEIYSENFIPKYPTSLPLSIGNSLIVSLDKASRKLIKEVFMEIEEPENPIIFPKKAFKHIENLQNLEYSTIGLFYAEIKRKISELSEDIFLNNLENQVVDSNLFSPQHLFLIKSKEDALNAIDIIVEQGEGTDKLPTGKGKELAHYYKFKEIVVGKELIEDSNSDLGYSYSGNEITFNESAVHQLWPNTKLSELENTDAHQVLLDFVKCYCEMLNSLQIGFNGNKSEIDVAFLKMYDLSSLAELVVNTEHPANPNFKISPSFEFIKI